MKIVYEFAIFGEIKLGTIYGKRVNVCSEGMPDELKFFLKDYSSLISKKTTTFMKLTIESKIYYALLQSEMDKDQNKKDYAKTILILLDSCHNITSHIYSMLKFGKEIRKKYYDLKELDNIIIVKNDEIESTDENILRKLSTSNFLIKQFLYNLKKEKVDEQTLSKLESLKIQNFQSDSMIIQEVKKKLEKIKLKIIKT